MREISHRPPGVFASNPDPSVDKSLWTLPIEVRAYIALAMIGAVGLLTAGMPLMAIGFFALSVAPDSITTAPIVGSGLNFLRGSGGEAAHLIAIVFFAALLYRHRKRITCAPTSPLWRWPRSSPRSARSSASCWSSRSRTCRSTSRIARGAACGRRRASATSPTASTSGLPRAADDHLSVGRPTLRAPLLVAAIAFPVTYLLALASWHGVEKRALRMKGALAGPRQPRVVARRPSPEPATPGPATASAQP